MKLPFSTLNHCFLHSSPFNAVALAQRPGFQFQNNGGGNLPQSAAVPQSVSAGSGAGGAGPQSSSNSPPSAPASQPQSRPSSRPVSHPPHQNHPAPVGVTGGAAVVGRVDYQCPDRFGFFPHHKSCDKYYSCENGTATLKVCGNGLVFDSVDPTRENCAYPFSVDCGERTDLGTFSCCPHSSPPFLLRQLLRPLVVCGSSKRGLLTLSQVIRSNCLLNFRPSSLHCSCLSRNVETPTY